MLHGVSMTFGGSVDEFFAKLIGGSLKLKAAIAALEMLCGTGDGC
jgi:hypothetical protein